MCNRVYAFDVLQEGGRWLGVTREYLISKAHLGDHLTWGSLEIVKGLTVRDIEEMVAYAVAADRNERNKTNTEVKALKAIVARYEGKYDNIDLIRFGPLSTSKEEDMYNIAKSSLEL